MDDIIKPVGYVEEFVDGELINSQYNTIHEDFKSSLKQFMDGASTPDLMSTSSFIDAQNIRAVSGNVQEDNNGVVLKDGNYSDNPYFTMETVLNYEDSPTHGTQWDAIQTAGEARSVTELVLGASLFNGTSPQQVFTHTLAYIDKSGSPLSLSQDQIYQISWGISFA